VTGSSYGLKYPGISPKRLEKTPSTTAWIKKKNNNTNNKIKLKNFSSWWE